MQRMTLRRAIGLTVVLSVGILMGLTVGAAGQFVGKSSIDTQLLLRRIKPVSTQDSEWHDVPGLSHQVICASRKLSGTTTLDLTAADKGVDVRVLVDGAAIKPENYHLDTGTASTDRNTFTLSFVESFAPGSHNLDLQWRSSSGQSVTLNSGSMTLLYAQQEGCV